MSSIDPASDEKIHSLCEELNREEVPDRQWELVHSLIDTIENEHKDILMGYCKLIREILMIYPEREMPLKGYLEVLFHGLELALLNNEGLEIQLRELKKS